MVVFGGEVNLFVVMFWWNLCKEVVCRDLIRVFCEDIDVVDVEVEGFVVRVGFLDECGMVEVD